MAKRFFTDESLATFVNETKTYTNNAVAELSSVVVYTSDSNENISVETTSEGGVTESVVNNKIAAAKNELIGTADDLATADTINGAKVYASELVEGLKSEIYYYTTVSGAIADIEAGTTEHAIANADEAYVKVFTSCDGAKTVMLLKDLLETAQISTTKNLNINLGGHTLTIDSSVAYIPFNSEMVCVSNGNIVIDITNGVQYASLITFWGNHVIMDNINLKVFGGTSQLIAGVYVTNNNGVYDIKNCKITVSNSLESAVAIYNNQGTLNVENTVIKADTDSAKNSIGITNKSRLTIVDSTIFADAPDNSTDRNGLSIGVHNYGTLYSINTDVCGTHSGMQNEGNVCIYGGAYKSCSHGGLYLVANGKGKTLVKDAIIACSDYTGIHDASAFSNSKLAALYLGSSSNSNGEIAYFDGCTIDATGANHVMVLRESNGDNLNVFNISNSTISDGENYIRMDGATVKLNIGVGTNITTDRLPSGANYEYTNEFYRKFGKDADIKGRDVNLVLATCATKNELDKIPNQVINILETNAIEQIPAKNLFNKNNYKALKAYINSTSKTLTSTSEATTVYIPVEANQVYTVSKIASKRFTVGITDSETMANGTTFTETIQTNTATSITINTRANSKNLAVFCHVTSADTLTVEEILDTLQIEKGDTATEYEAWHEPTYNAVDMTAREKADGLIGTSDDESSADTIYGAKAYAKELVDNYDASETCVAKNQGASNVGKILVVGTDGYLTLADMPEGGASGDVTGVLDESNNILLSGNLADGTYTLKWLNTDGSYSDAGSLTVNAIKKYTITCNLTNVTSDNSTTSIITGESFTASLTANDGYSISSVVVTMGGTDITSSAVNGSIISIASVTGDVVITAVASEPNYTNLATSFQEGYRFNSSGTTTAQDGATACLDYIPFTKDTVVKVKGFGDLTFTNSAVYSSSKSVLNCTKVTSMTSALTYSYDSANEIVTLTCIHDETAFIRIAGKLTGTTNDVIITVNEEIV